MFPLSTVKLLEGLENTSNIKHLLGLRAELLVIKHYLERNFSLKGHRTQLYKTEVDLIVESRSKIILIEVKYTTHMDFLTTRMNFSQKKRLQNVFLRFIETTPKEVEFHYVIVDQEGRMEIFDEFLADGH